MRQRFICAPSSVAAPAFGSPVRPVWARGGSSANSQGSAPLSRRHVAAVLVEQGARRLDVAGARRRELEGDALLLALASQLVHLRAQGLGRLGALGCLGDGALELRDLRVALRQQNPVVGFRPGSNAVGARSPCACSARRHSPGSPSACGPRHAADSSTALRDGPRRAKGAHLRRLRARFRTRVLRALRAEHRANLVPVHAPTFLFRRAQKMPAPLPMQAIVLARHKAIALVLQRPLSKLSHTG